MTPEETAPPQPLPTQDEPVSELRRLLGTFAAPSRTFASIARRPTWILPLALWTALSFLLGELVVSRTDWRSVVRASAERRGQTLSQGQLDQFVERTRRFAWMFDVIAVAAPAAIAGATAALLWMACQAFGWELAFRQAFGITAHAYLPAVLASAVILAMLWSRRTIDPQSFSDVLPTSLAFLVSRPKDPTLHSLLSSLNLLSLWTIGLLVLGLSAATKVARGPMAALVLTMWGLYVAGKAGLTAIFSS